MEGYTDAVTEAELACTALHVATTSLHLIGAVAAGAMIEVFQHVMRSCFGFNVDCSEDHASAVLVAGFAIVLWAIAIRAYSKMTVRTGKDAAVRRPVEGLDWLDVIPRENTLAHARATFALQSVSELLSVTVGTESASRPARYPLSDIPLSCRSPCELQDLGFCQDGVAEHALDLIRSFLLNLGAYVSFPALSTSSFRTFVSPFTAPRGDSQVTLGLRATDLARGLLGRHADADSL